MRNVPFKVGDEVLLAHDCRDSLVNEHTQYGYCNSWTHDMSELIGNGQIYHIKRIIPEGIYFDEDYASHSEDVAERYGWPPGALQLATGQLRLFI